MSWSFSNHVQLWVQEQVTTIMYWNFSPTEVSHTFRSSFLMCVSIEWLTHHKNEGKASTFLFRRVPLKATQTIIETQPLSNSSFFNTKQCTHCHTGSQRPTSMHTAHSQCRDCRLNAARFPLERQKQNLPPLMLPYFCCLFNE